MPSKKELLRRWVEALRSGKYQQGRMSLNPAQGHYCCLGVLCEISGVGRWVDPTDDYDALMGYQVPGSYTVWTSMLPTVLREAVGVTIDEQVVYIGLNDSAHATFEDIASEIELRHPEVFANG